MKKMLTLCIIHQRPRVLVGMKKRGFGAGRWNGFGGKVEEGETIEDAARREMKEEVGIVPTKMTHVGVLVFSFESDPKELEVHVFRVTEISGEPRESEEMKPEWFDIGNIPFDNIWHSDTAWLPLLLEGKSFRGAFHYDRPSDPNYAGKILRQSLEIVDGGTHER